MDFTPNLNLPIPNADAVPPKNISQQFPDIAIALTMLDEIVHNLQVVVAGKADTDHTQAMSTITGLVEALAAKMPANQTFSLDSLTDVQGAAEALVNYVLVKNASGFWVPSTALAALGVHNHAISEVVGLADLLTDIEDAIDALNLNKANKATTVTGGGLASGGGDLSGNRVITVAKATDAEHQARARDDVAATPKGVGLALVAYNKWRMLEDVDLTSVASYVKGDLSAFEALRLDGEVTYSANGANGVFQISTDNGASWITNGYVFNGGTSTETSSIVPGYNGNTNGFILHPNAMTSNGSFPNKFLLNIGNFNKTLPKTALLLAFGVTSGSLNAVTFAGLRSPSVLQANAFRLLPSAGNFSRMTFTLEGKEG